MKASKEQAKKTIVLGMLVLVTLMVVTCEYLPTRPVGKELTPLGSVVGTACGFAYAQDIYQNKKTQDIVSVFKFVDTSGKGIGNAELTAAEDLVKLISNTKFKTPGKTTLKIGKCFTVEVKIGPSPTPLYKYQIDATRLDTKALVSIDLPDQKLLKAALSGSVALLCFGPCETITAAIECWNTAPSYCSASGVSYAFMQGTMSVKDCCSKGIQSRVICKSHDQGSIGR